MVSKLIGKEIKMKCGATVELKGKSPWLHGGRYQRVLQFRITDPNQSFFNLNRDSDEDQSTVNIAVTRDAIPAVIRLLNKAYKETKPTRLSAY